MKPRSLEQILEECLSAYLEGRRGINESLALYPGLAEELEPLLSTAVEIAARVDYGEPPAAFQEQLRERFLIAAATRRRERMRERKPVAAQSGWGWRFRSTWSLAAGATIAVIVALTLGGMALLRDGDDGPGGVIVELVPTPSPAAEPTAAPFAVADITSQLEKARSDLAALQAGLDRGDPIESGEIGALKDSTQEIVDQLAGAPSVLEAALGEDDKEALASVISDEYKLLSSLDEAELSEGELADVEEALALTEELARKLGVPLLTPTPEPTPMPTPTATPEPTPTPTPTPEPTSEVTPTPEPEPEPTPSPTPAPTTEPEVTPSNAAPGAVLFDTVGEQS